MRYPVDNKKITSPYGKRTLPGRDSVFHYGVDFTGKNKIAVAPCGIIIDRVLSEDIEYPCKFKLSKGVFVPDLTVPSGRAWTPFVIAHSMTDSNLSFVFKHVSPVVKMGEAVEEGEAVGNIGNFGFSMGAHLHFEVLINSKNVNPEEWLKENVR